MYATLDRLTPHKVQTFSHQPKRDLFVWPLGVAAAALLASQLLAVAWSRRPGMQA